MGDFTPRLVTEVPGGAIVPVPPTSCAPCSDDGYGHCPVFRPDSRGVCTCCGHLRACHARPLGEYYDSLADPEVPYRTPLVLVGVADQSSRSMLIRQEVVREQRRQDRGEFKQRRRKSR